MGDIDLIVPSTKRPTLEAALRAHGFVETDRTGPASRYSSHHHGVPLWHPDLRVWLEVHSRLYSPKSPLASDRRFNPESVESQLTATPFRHRKVNVLKPESQLVYTCARWAEYPNPQRGAFPVLDAALLLASGGNRIDWALVIEMVGRSWAASAVRVMLEYLGRHELGRVPSDVMRRLASADRFTNRLLVGALHRFVTTYVMEGRPPGAVLTPRNLRSVWATMIGPAPPSTKLWTVPMNVAFPDGVHGRLNAALAGRRLRSMTARLIKR